FGPAGAFRARADAQPLPQCARQDGTVRDRTGDAAAGFAGGHRHTARLAAADDDDRLVTPAGGYGAGALLRDLRTRFRRGWNAIDSADRKRWLRLIAGGIAGMIVLMLALVGVGKALVASGALAWEVDFLRGLETDGPFSYSTAVWFQTFGTDITLWILVALTAGIALWMGRPLTALSIILAYAVVDAVVRLGWLTWDRAR